MPRIASSLCRDVLHEFTTKCTRVQDCLLPEMAKLLELDDDYFINHSAPTPGSTLPSMLEAGSCLRSEAFGLKPHSDGTFVTLLMVDNSVSRLQVFRDRVWYDVLTRPHTLLINLGDQIEVMNDHS